MPPALLAQIVDGRYRAPIAAILVLMLSLSVWPWSVGHIASALLVALLACCGILIALYANRLAKAERIAERLRTENRRLADHLELSRTALESLDLQQTLDGAVALISRNINADCRAAINVAVASPDVSVVSRPARHPLEVSNEPELCINIEAADCQYGVLKIVSRVGRPLSPQDARLVHETARIVGAVVHHQQANTARLAREAELSRRAFHDPLTALPNRALFNDRLEHAVASAERKPGLTAVLFIDLDGFKAINDTLGHSAGDRVLILVADRLKECLREGDTAARIGGDEFAIILEQTTEAETARVAARIQEALSLPLLIQEQQIQVGASIGIAHASSTRDADRLVEQADRAMYSAKRARRR